MFSVVIKVSHLPMPNKNPSNYILRFCNTNPSSEIKFRVFVHHGQKRTYIMHTRLVLLKNQDFLRFCKRSNICFQQFLSSQHDEMALFGMECLFTINTGVHSILLGKWYFPKPDLYINCFRSSFLSTYFFCRL